MLLLKKGFPEEEELVFCTVRDVQFHCVFVSLDEYENKSGMIHISEIAAGRIKNTREYVQEGKKVVCKVLRINLEKGHIDLSLRRVNQGQRQKKLDELKQEQSAEKIIEFVAKEKKLDLKTVFTEVLSAVQKKYLNIYSCFEDVALADGNLEKLGIKKDLAKALTEVVKQRVKAPEVHISGDLFLISYEPDGADLVKEAIAKAKGTDITIKYKGGGTFLVDVKSTDFKRAEKVLEKSLESTMAFAKQKKILADFKRKEE